MCLLLLLMLVVVWLLASICFWMHLLVGSLFGVLGLCLLLLYWWFSWCLSISLSSVCFWFGSLAALYTFGILLGVLLSFRFLSRCLLWFLLSAAVTCSSFGYL